MRIYFAGPLFSAAERDWNEAATIRIDAIAAPIDRVAREVLDALARIEI